MMKLIPMSESKVCARFGRICLKNGVLTAVLKFRIRSVRFYFPPFENLLKGRFHPGKSSAKLNRVIMGHSPCFFIYLLKNVFYFSFLTKRQGCLAYLHILNEELCHQVLRSKKEVVFCIKRDHHVTRSHGALFSPVLIA